MISLNNLVHKLTSRKSKIIGIGLFSFLLLKHYFNGARCKYSPNITGKLVLITGCNTGIGE